MQTRIFDTTDRTKMVRTVISTFQDLGYNIDKVDAGSGTVTATKLAVLQMSAAVSPRGPQTGVRANAVIRVSGRDRKQVDAPEFYQQLFFAPLSEAIFLTAQAEPASSGPEIAAPVPPTLPIPSGKPTS